MHKCFYCNHLVQDDTLVPEIDDDAGWDKLALEHAPDCSWLTTRAHRLDPAVVKARKKG